MIFYSLNESPTIHASAVLVGARAVLIRGPSGSGKSKLVLDLLQAAEAGLLPFARLVADDRAEVQAAHGRLLVRPAKTLSGLLEVRGLGIRKVEAEPLAVVGWVIDLSANDVARLPAAEAGEALIEGIMLPRLAVAAGQAPFPLLLALLRTLPSHPPTKALSPTAVAK